MLIGGIDTDALPPQFEPNAVVGRTLILDGDGPAYVAAATVKRLDTAVRNFQSHVLKQQFMTNAIDVRIHLTHKTSDKHGRFRVNAIKPYQGQRTGPKPPMLHVLRDAIADPTNWLANWDVTMHYDLEADDGMMIDAYALKEHGVMCSEDKDLRATPYPYYDMEKGIVLAGEPVGWLTMKYTPAGNPKVIGQGPLFFWWQMLAGDTADNVRGILKYEGKQCGIDSAYKALMHVTDIDEAANLVISAYRKINQNPIPEAWLMWILPQPKFNVIEYFKTLGLSKENQDFLNDCSTRSWCRARGDTPAAHENEGGA